MTTHRRARSALPWSLGGLGGLVLVGLASLASAGGCTVASRDVGGNGISPCTEGCPGPDASTDGPIEASQVPFDGGSDPDPRNTNCGSSTACNPDPSEALSGCSSSPLSVSGHLVDGSPTPAQHGELGSSIPLEINDPGAAGSAGASGAAGAAGASTSSPTERVRACHVVPTATAPAARCIFSGQAAEGEACRGFIHDTGTTPATDCAPGLACVRNADKVDSTVGQCRPYCCYASDGCGPGAWCSPRRVFVASDSAATPAFVPVCTPADSCKLLEEGACPQGQTCQLVADETTSCDVPGNGKEGQACPCASGQVCSRATNTCRTLCHTGLSGECPQGAVCTGGSTAFPPGIGVCTGG